MLPKVDLSFFSTAITPHAGDDTFESKTCVQTNFIQATFISNDISSNFINSKINVIKQTINNMQQTLKRWGKSVCITSMLEDRQGE